MGEYGRTKDKPSIIDYIEAVVVDFLATNKFGFDIKEKKQANKSLAVYVCMFHFVHSNRKALSYNKSSKFNTSIFQG